MAGGGSRKCLSQSHHFDHSRVSVQGWASNPSKVYGSFSSTREIATGHLHGDLAEPERPLQSGHHLRPPTLI